MEQKTWEEDGLRHAVLGEKKAYVIQSLASPYPAPAQLLDGQNGLPSTGILYVVVNGTIVVKDSEVLKGVNPEQSIRFEPVKSRFEPITIEGWTKTYCAAPIDFGGGVPGMEQH